MPKRKKVKPKSGRKRNPYAVCPDPQCKGSVDEIIRDESDNTWMCIECGTYWDVDGNQYEAEIDDDCDT